MQKLMKNCKILEENMKNDKLVTLIIMDGLGMPKDLSVSAVLPENTTNLRAIAEKYPCGTLKASEEAVGLLPGQMGTSEVGHLTMGAGRINYQPMVRINNEIKQGNFAKNKAILKAIENAKTKNCPLHLMGIVSDGGVHSHIDHLVELIKIASENKVEKVYIHFIADGRDTPAKSALLYLETVQNAIKKYNCGEIVDVCGRFYALDRDKNWDRVQVYYNLLTENKAKFVKDIKQGILDAYEKGETDEFLTPIAYAPNGKYYGGLNKGDSLIMFNFRTDRARQTARVLSNDNDFDWTKKLDLTLVTLTNYDESLKGVLVAYENIELTNMLGQVLADRGYKEMRIAETEKFAHVTFFFNAGRNEPYDGEERILIDSEKLATYDKKPEMSAEKIAKSAVESIKTGKFNVVILNFANGDMVGHSGNKEAAKVAVGVVDRCVKAVCDATIEMGGKAIITADHGNCDIMTYPDGSPHKSHTLNLVPFIIAGKGLEGVQPKKNSGTLSDIAPTILHLLGESAPKEMTGHSLI